MASPAGSIKIEGHNGTRSIPRTVVDSDFPEKSQGLVSAKVRIERTSPEEAQESSGLARDVVHDKRNSKAEHGKGLGEREVEVLAYADGHRRKVSEAFRKDP